MKQLFFLVSLLSLATLSISCKSKKEVAANSIETITNTNDENALKYRLIVSFISKGAGIDGNLHNSIVSFISNHPKKPVSKTVLWGREGETDQCFTLSELTKTEQQKFVSDLKNLIGTSDMIQLTENAKCQHKGR